MALLFLRLVGNSPGEFGFATQPEKSEEAGAPCAGPAVAWGRPGSPAHRQWPPLALPCPCSCLTQLLLSWPPRRHTASPGKAGVQPVGRHLRSSEHAQPCARCRLIDRWQTVPPHWCPPPGSHTWEGAPSLGPVGTPCHPHLASRSPGGGGTSIACTWSGFPWASTSPPPLNLALLSLLSSNTRAFQAKDLGDSPQDPIYTELTIFTEFTDYRLMGVTKCPRDVFMHA